MSEILTPLQTIVGQGFVVRMFNGMLIASPWSKMTKDHYDYISSNSGAIIAELNAEAVSAGNSNLCGYTASYVPEVASNDYASWHIPDAMRSAMGYQEISWRQPINLAHGRPALA